MFQGEPDWATAPAEGDGGGRRQGGEVRPGREAPHQEIHRGVPANTGWGVYSPDCSNWELPSWFCWGQRTYGLKYITQCPQLVKVESLASKSLDLSCVFMVWKIAGVCNICISDLEKKSLAQAGAGHVTLLRCKDTLMGASSNVPNLYFKVSLHCVSQYKCEMSLRQWGDSQSCASFFGGKYITRSQ